MKYLLFTCILFSSVKSQAQTVQEWTQQKKTQLRYLMQQIAANKTYGDYLQRGYRIARQGLTTINQAKNDEFNLHRTFLTSFGGMNPGIKASVWIGQIIGYQVRLLKKNIEAHNLLTSCTDITKDDRIYALNVLNRVVDDCLKNLDDLILVTKPEQFQMRDNERIFRLNQIFERVQDNYLFTRSFANECLNLINGRKNELAEIELSRIINQIK